MKFDVVIGNPPYNSGMDLDFVNKGFDLCEQYCVMITPAKWQTAADDYSGCASKTIDYKGFREKLVPHMSKVVFYQSATDVFDIEQRDGISYYLLAKYNTYDKCEVTNVFKNNKLINGKDTRSIGTRETLINDGDKIIKHLGVYVKFKFNHPTNLRYQVWINTQLSGAGGNMYTKEGNTMCLCESRIIDTQKGEKSYSEASKCVFSSDNREECENFVSWIDTKFTRFFVVINISKLGPILTDDYFRFVPAPPSGKFDHIYTDEELYKAFNLPQKYIDVIEAVIKERK